MPFGAEASPFILGATLRYQIDQQPEDFAETVAVEELRTNTYVDNLMKTGGQVEEMRKFTHILEDAKFKVHKWESNIEELEDQNMPNPSRVTIALVKQDTNTVQGLVTSKSRISKTNGTMHRLELVAGHTTAIMANNVQQALPRWPVVSITIWMDSTVALHWLMNPRNNWKVFVANRV